MSIAAIDTNAAERRLLGRLREAQRVTDSLDRDPREDSHVYFIQQGYYGPIKIGRSVDVIARLHSLQTGCAEHLRILGVSILGGAALERRLHEMFAADRMSGEWFKPSELLYDVISDFGGAG